MPKNDYHIADVIVAYNGNGHGQGNHREPSTSSAYEVNSGEVQEIMSKMPHWIIRQGATISAIVMMLLFAGSYFIHYPDTTVTNLNITSSNPAIKVVAQSSGRIHEIFIRNNQMVQRNDNICLLENTARYNDMLLLRGLLKRLDTTFNLAPVTQTVSFDQYMQLGELQPGYANLYESVQKYVFFSQRNFITQKVDQLQSQVQYQAALAKELQSKDNNLKMQLLLERKKFEADSLLAKEKVIAPLELNNSRNELINKQMIVDATKSGIIQNNLQQTEYLKTITDLKQQKLQQENDLQQQIRENVKLLLAQWEAWEQKYLIRSPVEGKAIFFNVWKENQYVTNGEAVLMIVPPLEEYVIKASLSLAGAGKVKIGQKVLIRLTSYPFEEFGMLQGNVVNISDVALDTAFNMEIALSNGLITNIGKKIPPQANLAGVAEIYTDDKSILARLFEKVWNGNKR